MNNQYSLRLGVKKEDWFFTMQEKLPHSWLEVNFMDITWLITCGVAKKPNYVEKGIPFLSAQNSKPFKANLNDIKFITEEDFQKFTVGGKPEKNDVLYSRVGAKFGESAKVTFDFDFAIYVSLTLIKPIHSLVDSDFLVAFLNSIYGNIQAHAGIWGSGIQNLNVNRVRQYRIPLPPVNEQRRIVAKIETLKARSQQVKEALEDIPQLLDQFRQSVLAAAFRGDLTADWREQNPDVEPASVLLERIRAERRHRWEEAELEKMKASGKVPKDDKWKEKYKEPELVDDSQLRELPDGWCWVTAEECTSLITDGEHATPERSNDGVYLLSARNILNGRLSFEKVDFVPETVYQKLEKRLKIEAGDVFLSCSGSVGRSCVVPSDIRCALVRSVAVLRPLFKMGEYLSLGIRSPYLQSQIEQKKTHTAQANIFQGRIKTLVIPVAPFKEQKIIVNSIAQAFKYIESIEKTLDDVSNQSTTLDQSILAKAFRGELVPQDPNDEPASILLERIRAERAKLQTKAAKKSTPPTGGRRSKKASQQEAEPVQLELGLE